ncbi:MAG: hypothetical protein FJX63_09535 [Alphaproteobacteria bacterium]|nr:hypothetical protein [Alphaproteobacteria bacterium]
MSGFAARLIGAFVFLLIGVAEVIVIRRSVYPVIRWRHEKAKLTQSQGRDPGWIMGVAWFQGLVLMPIFGFMAGGWLSASEG